MEVTGRAMYNPYRCLRLVLNYWLLCRIIGSYGTGITIRTLMPMIIAFLFVYNSYYLFMYGVMPVTNFYFLFFKYVFYDIILFRFYLLILPSSSYKIISTISVILRIWTFLGGGDLPLVIGKIPIKYTVLMTAHRKVWLCFLKRGVYDILPHNGRKWFLIWFSLPPCWERY